MRWGKDKITKQKICSLAHRLREQSIRASLGLDRPVQLFVNNISSADASSEVAPRMAHYSYVKAEPCNCFDLVDKEDASISTSVLYCGGACRQEEDQRRLRNEVSL